MVIKHHKELIYRGLVLPKIIQSIIWARVHIHLNSYFITQFNVPAVLLRNLTFHSVQVSLSWMFWWFALARWYKYELKLKLDFLFQIKAMSRISGSTLRDWEVAKRSLKDTGILQLIESEYFIYFVWNSIMHQLFLSCVSTLINHLMWEFSADMNSAFSLNVIWFSNSLQSFRYLYFFYFSAGAALMKLGGKKTVTVDTRR